MSYLKQNNLPAARQHLDGIREDSKVHENAQGLLAGALLGDQQFENADDVLRRILTRHPKSAIACRQLSGLSLTELRFREAVNSTTLNHCCKRLVNAMLKNWNIKSLTVNSGW